MYISPLLCFEICAIWESCPETGLANPFQSRFSLESFNLHYVHTHLNELCSSTKGYWQKQKTQQRNTYLPLFFMWTISLSLGCAFFSLTYQRHWRCPSELKNPNQISAWHTSSFPPPAETSLLPRSQGKVFCKAWSGWYHMHTTYIFVVTWCIDNGNLKTETYYFYKLGGHQEIVTAFIVIKWYCCHFLFVSCKKLPLRKVRHKPKGHFRIGAYKRTRHGLSWSCALSRVECHKKIIKKIGEQGHFFRVTSILLRIPSISCNNELGHEQWA